ncbi:uncharacterized protein LACBIDRAFT_329411 [Laccaria bicolor S238N-H82]|uniref:Predicted protein n=1 Tax=Laccaria bicolor (strain S238N-H82 / ATCC MYA-4686) TaxID=486041 RepID=B0DHX6_LACBS|nr:uncharacterized protein LACBIDRAFT_329411 [Laccaria bicolor S238N-H82]EDR05909.1 predicted protein [Laccaria bicolor S238N-H82]|eukprot:XP_001883585.1 predicted protein [Laccaria bicolor S238N-H82]
MHSEDNGVFLKAYFWSLRSQGLSAAVWTVTRTSPEPGLGIEARFDLKNDKCCCADMFFNLFLDLKNRGLLGTPTEQEEAISRLLWRYSLSWADAVHRTTIRNIDVELGCSSDGCSLGEVVMSQIRDLVETKRQDGGVAFAGMSVSNIIERMGLVIVLTEVPFSSEEICTNQRWVYVAKVRLKSHLPHHTALGPFLNDDPYCRLIVSASTANSSLRFTGDRRAETESSMEI